MVIVPLSSKMSVGLFICSLSFLRLPIFPFSGRVFALALWGLFIIVAPKYFLIILTSVSSWCGGLTLAFAAIS